MRWINRFRDAEEIAVLVPAPEASYRKGPIMARKSEAMAVQSLVDLDSEESIGLAGVAGKVVSVAKRQQASARKSYDEAPKCVHCGGRMHMNLPAATLNFECMWRQFCLANGLMNDPGDRLPAFGDENIVPFGEWAATRKRSRKNPLTYGKMESEKGYGTYAAMKQATAKDVKSASEMAEEVEAPKRKKKKVVSVLPVEEPKAKKKKTIESPAISSAPVKKTKKVQAPKPEMDDLVLLDDEPVTTKTKKTKNKPVTQGSAVAKSGKAKRSKAA